jgi:DNA-directed RNA polymerase specialized sigma24 family protein
MYAEGRSLAEVGEHFGVDKGTVANRFLKAGLPVRRRRGWA